MNTKPISKLYRPHQFFSWVFVLSWLPWIAAAYFSRMPNQNTTATTLALIGLAGPVLAALIMMRKTSDAIKRDCKRRLIDFKSISVQKLMFVLAVILLTLIGATWLSIQLGLSAMQFELSSGFIAMLPFAFMAALMEELGWRSYGVDSLKAHLSMRATTLIFALLWALWHVPLFFILQTYQHGLWLQGYIYVANFFISILPATILANWFYYKSQRSVPAAVIFHFALVAFSELLQTAPQTKILITVLLTLVVIALIKFDIGFFLNKNTPRKTNNAIPKSL